MVRLRALRERCRHCLSYLAKGTLAWHLLLDKGQGAGDSGQVVAQVRVCAGSDIIDAWYSDPYVKHLSLQHNICLFINTH